MPELPEIEAYRGLAERALGRTLARVVTPDDWYLKGGLTGTALRRALKGRSFVGARRIGKLLLLDTSDGGPVVGLRFGMTGRLVVDDVSGVDDLIYSSRRDEPKWDRCTFVFADGGRMRMQDPRRLGGVTLDPDESRLGADARGMSLDALRQALGISQSPLKARLMNQAQLAGAGNLIVDETLWRAGLDPRRPSASLTATELRKLHRHLTKVVEDLITRGGSHTGDFLPHRVRGGSCPKDGAVLERATVGGRTTYWCPRHQV